MPIALIIGGTSGIGLEAARQLVALGDVVHVAGRDPRRVAEAEERVPGVIGHRLDAADRESVSRIFDELGTVDRLIVTLSGSKGAGPLEGLDLDELRVAFDEKLWPTLTVVQASVPHLSDRASITLVGAVTARAGMPGTAGIGALNAAVEGLVQPLAAELAPVRVNAVSPGYVDTPWWSMVADDDRAAMFDQIAAGLPTRRIGEPADVASAVVLLAVNPNITGTVLETDGGAHLTA